MPFLFVGVEVEDLLQQFDFLFLAPPFFLSAKFISFWWTSTYGSDGDPFLFYGGGRGQDLRNKLATIIGGFFPPKNQKYPKQQKDE